MNETIPETTAYLLWDGDCGLCEKCAHWITKNITQNSIIILPFQKVKSPLMTPELHARCSKSIQLVFTNGKTVEGAVAVVSMLNYTKYARITPFLSSRLVEPVIVLLYSYVAKNRKLISRILNVHASSGNTCTIAPPE